MNAQTHRAIFLSVTGAIMVGFVAVASAQEPNDDVSTATFLVKVPPEIDPFGSTTSASGVIGDGPFPSRDVDLYYFVLDPDAVPVWVGIDVIFEDDGFNGFDPYLRLFDFDLNEIAFGDESDWSFSGARIVHEFTGAGNLKVFFVGVSDARNANYDPADAGSGRATGTVGPYELRMEYQASTLDSSPFEPNDAVDAATEMGGASFTVTNEFIGDGPHPDRDVDSYSLQLDSAAVIHAEVFADRIDSTLDPILRLRHCADASPVPQYPDICGLGTSDDVVGIGRDAALTAVVQEPGEVFVMVSGAQNARYDPAVAGSGRPGSTGTYDLHVDVEPFDPTGPLEPNDSIPMATQLGEIVPGRFDVLEAEAYLGDGPFGPSRGDRDFYKFSLSGETRPLQIDLAADSIGSDLQAVVSVYDEAGVQLAQAEALDGPQDLHLVIPAWCTWTYTDGTQDKLIVMVSSVGQRPPDDLEYPIPGGPTAVSTYDGTPSVGDYRLTIQTGPEAAPNSKPNDTIPTATPTGLVDEGAYVGHGVSGDGPCSTQYGSNGGDLDIWSFDVTDPPVVLTARASACPDYDGFFDIQTPEYFLQVLDETGAEVDRFVKVAYACVDPRPTFRTVINQRGTYYLVFGTSDYWICSVPPYDPFTACTLQYDAYGLGEYDVSISLSPTKSRQAACDNLALAQGDGAGAGGLFVSNAEVLEPAAIELDPVTGVTTSPIELSGRPGGGSEGLAFDGSDLWFMEGGRYPRIFRQDGVSSTVIDSFDTWAGSGFYSDLTELGGKLFLLDYIDDAIHVLDAATGRFECTVPVGDRGGVSISGGLAALTGPNRLYAADAFHTQGIYEITMSGGITNTLPPPDLRPIALGAIGAGGPSMTSADSLLFVGDWEHDGVDVLTRAGHLVDGIDLSFPVASCGGNGNSLLLGDGDLDGDLDLVDVMRLQRCFGLSGGLDDMCATSDLTGDGRVNLADVALFAMSVTGP